MSEETKYWTVKQLAEAANVSGTYVRRLLTHNVIKGIKHGDGKRGTWEIPAREAIRWLESRKQR